MYCWRVRWKLRRKQLILVAICFLLFLTFTPLPLVKQSTHCPSRDGFLASIAFCQLGNVRWDLFYHLGGNGPWIPRETPVGIPESLPAQCTVEQVHLLSRHAERFPTKTAGARHLALLKRLNDSNTQLHGSLRFVRQWSYFTDVLNPAFENLTTEGQYAGTLQAYNTGIKFRQRYSHLISNDSVTNLWSCSSPRDVETARCFANGFFGPDWEHAEHAKLHIIPETTDQGANTLTPSDTCLRYRSDKVAGHSYGHSKLAEWQEVFSKPISSRLRADAGNLDLTPAEVYSMMEMCGFELMARGSSPWCDVFSQQEWLNFEYARDVLHYYRAGPGNRYSAAMGWLWLNATLSLLTTNTKLGVYFSFVHDSDVIAVISAMGLFKEKGGRQYLPVDYIKNQRSWKISDVVPMGGHLVFERIACGDGKALDGITRRFVRVKINDGIYDMKSLVGRTAIPGAVPLDNFETYLQQRASGFEDFVDICGLPPDSLARITFLEQ